MGEQVGSGYDVVQLRSFLAVAQARSFTRAAARLGVGQPTVSQHVRKLEAATGRLLVLRDTRSVSLTPDGEAMIGLAQEIVAAHERATAYFRGQRPHGRLRMGMSDDLALTRLPAILREFRRENPLVDLDLAVDQSGTLHRRLAADRLDVYVGRRPAAGDASRHVTGAAIGEQLVSRERMVWVGTPTTRLDPAAPVPLVLYPPPSIARTMMEEALQRAGTAYRTAALCRGTNGLIAAVAAGIGLSAVPRSLVPPQLSVLRRDVRAEVLLPELGTTDLVLLTNPRTAERPASRALVAAVLASGPAVVSG
ncbi:LysR family transcriptional regulator [Quadrisphaera sp. KR29]|uniref:LysR family transcriptional regulator n=1 Tax=Quadrisphaera sp. KR29 TaxID=3461391 RepID=UPI00404409CA